VKKPKWLRWPFGRKPKDPPPEDLKKIRQQTDQKLRQQAQNERRQKGEVEKR
jgi:hypothetical protein